MGCDIIATGYPGQSLWRGYGGPSGCNVDSESKVKIHPGYEATNLNVKQNLPMLPIQVPRIPGYFDSGISSSLRFEPQFNKKQCTLTSEQDFTKYTFDPFNFKHLCYNPQDPKYIIPEESFNKCYPNAKLFHWGGSDTRHDRQERYRNGCDYKAKYYPPNASYSSFGY